MQVLTILMMLMLGLILIEEFVALALDVWLPRVTFRGFNLVASLHLSSSVRPHHPDRGKVFSTENTRYRVVSTSELVFRARSSWIHPAWPYCARVKADGAN